jgi:citrate lyase subunit beta/citryl-CoA lyase
MRSLLFVPAHRQRLVEKALGLPCDMVILDLEDSVPDADRAAARDGVREATKALGGRQWALRINMEESADHGLDMVLAREVSPSFVVVPKVSTARQAHDVYAVCQTPVIAMIETPLGVLDARAIAAQAGVVGLLAGVNDLRHELRVPAMAPRSSIALALQAMILAARAEGCAVFDGVFNRLDDPAGLAEECREGRVLGFDGKSLIHPGQIEVANAAFMPDENELAAARALVDAYRGGAQRQEGAMIEAMHVDAARALLARAGEGAR